MAIRIQARWDSERVLYASESASAVREAVIEAVAARANLARAYLAGAYLAGASLDGANLARANLARAYLARAYLARANLDGANLARANLAGASLAGANLARANLDGARINWQSHDLIAELLRRAAAGDVERRKVAGLVLVSRDWCWEQFLAIESDLRGWALDTLAAHITEGDNAPAILVRHKASQAPNLPPQP